MQLQKHMKVGAGALAASIFGILFGWVIFPPVLRGQIRKEMALSKKTDVRQMWEKIPFALDFKVYFFNYTNVEEIQKGGIPIVKEIGPYYFEEWKEKVQIEDHEEDDTITYKKLDRFYFKPELSGPGLTGEEIIVTPHTFVIALSTIIATEKPGMLSTLIKALKGIFDDPQDVFMRIKAMDLMFRGMIINCNQTDFAPKAMCTGIKKEAGEMLIFEPNNQFRFSLFGMRNGTVDKHVITVKRGINNVMDVGQVVAIDGKPQMDIWRDSCNEYQGTDGTVFPPFLKETDRLKSFSTDLCRSFKPWYKMKTSYKGIKTNHYVADIGDFANDPELNCFCKTPDNCPKKGLMELTPCLKVPMYASMPHFLESDPSLLQGIKGLSPDVKEHGIEIDFEPISGTPMIAKQRVQFNIQLLKIEKLEQFKDLPGTMAPIFWIEEGLSLNKTFVKMLKNQLFIPMRVVGAVKWILALGGFLGAVGAGVYHFKGFIMSYAVEPGAENANDDEKEHGEKPISIVGNPDGLVKITS